jgi:hypothetical protein
LISSFNNPDLSLMYKYHYINEIIKYMNKTGVNYAELGRKTGLTRFAIYNIVRRKSKNPGKNITDKLDKFFDELYSTDQNLYQ